MTPNGVFLGENPSFSNNENHTPHTMFFSNQNERIGFGTP